MLVPSSSISLPPDPRLGPCVLLDRFLRPFGLGFELRVFGLGLQHLFDLCFQDLLFRSRRGFELFQLLVGLLEQLLEPHRPLHQDFALIGSLLLEVRTGLASSPEAPATTTEPIAQTSPEATLLTGSLSSLHEGRQTSARATALSLAAGLTKPATPSEAPALATLTEPAAEAAALTEPTTLAGATLPTLTSGRQPLKNPSPSISLLISAHERSSHLILLIEGALTPSTLSAPTPSTIRHSASSHPTVA
jgi:hypothetical protein